MSPLRIEGTTEHSLGTVVVLASTHTINDRFSTRELARAQAICGCGFTLFGCGIDGRGAQAALWRRWVAHVQQARYEVACDT